MTSTITKNDLQALVTHNNVDEITEMGMSFNIMVGRIRDLVDAEVKEQENLKKAELRALQAQINPHFLYNTLDTIIWMAESKKTDQVIEIVRALSNFFRISLSKGRDWITIGEEVERTRSYLTIQKMRYRDILDFRIEMDEAVAGNTVLKLILQPLVENALYHGIKNKRQGGTIVIRVQPQGADRVLLEVEDNGIGFAPEKLAQVRRELDDNSGEIRLESGYGIGNVNNRIKLYYGREYGVSITSEYQVGTCVSIVIPARSDETPRKRPARYRQADRFRLPPHEPEEDGMMFSRILARVALAAFLFVILAACSPRASQEPAPAAAPATRAADTQQAGKKSYGDLIVGYAQLGAESEWRSANTASVKEAAEALGVELKFSDAQQHQENQITAIRSFIAQRVDVIGVAPLKETGWDEVFQEAKAAGIPIILVDRRADVSPDLYVTLLGSDFLEEGRNAARIMATLTNGQANIVELVGTEGSAPANDRYKGFREVLLGYPGMKIIDSRPGDFTVSQGKEAMEALLKEHGRNITALYAHNDDMALGAIKAIEAYGLKPGVDIKIVSVDAARGAFEAMIAGKLNATVECNPLLGPEFLETAPQGR